MGAQRLDRRQVLRGAGVAAGGAAVGSLGLAMPANASEESDDDLTGSWMVMRQDDGSPMRVRLVLSFAEGGVFLAHDISPAGPPFTGTWEEGEDDRFRATSWTGFPGEGPETPGPTVRVRAWGRVVDGMLSGSYRFTVFAPGSDTVLDSGRGTFSGRRIEA